MKNTIATTVSVVWHDWESLRPSFRQYSYAANKQRRRIVYGIMSIGGDMFKLYLGGKDEPQVVRGDVLLQTETVRLKRDSLG